MLQVKLGQLMGGVRMKGSLSSEKPVEEHSEGVDI